MSKLITLHNAGKENPNKIKRLQKLQQATMETLTILAETDNLPWTVQTVLLNIIATTGVQSGAVRLSNGEDYAFTTQESTDFEKNISPGCRLERNLKLCNTMEKGKTLPCMFNGGLFCSEGFYCVGISDWYNINAGSFSNQKPHCEKCKEFGYETIVMVPIKTTGKFLGLIHLYDSREKAICSDGIAFLETISSPFGYALKHLQDKEAILKSEEKLKFSYEQLKAFSSMILRVQEEERKHLSRELHDEVGQALTAVKIDLQILKDKLDNVSGFQERLSESIKLVDATLERIRKKAVSLRPPALDHLGLVEAVQNMVQGFSRRTGIETTLKIRGNTVRLPGETETALFRCIQESLTNIARHSGAKKAKVELEYLTKEVHATVEDNGKGFEQDALSPHLGLMGMQERVKLLNGSFKIFSRPNSGSCLKIKIPLI